MSARQNPRTTPQAADRLEAGEAAIIGLSPWAKAVRLEEMALRAERGWTMTEAGARCGLTRQEISHLEHGRRVMGLDTLVKVAAGYGLEPDAYLHRSRRWLLAPERRVWTREAASKHFF